MKAYSLDLREKILGSYLNHEGSVRQLAKRFKVSFRFVWGLIDKFRHTGSVAPKPHGGGNPARIKGSSLERLRELVAQHPDATLKELCDFLKTTCSIHASISSLHRALDILGLTRKKKTFHATEQDSEAVKRARDAYREKVRTIDVNDFVFLDETGVHIAMARTYARAHKGIRVQASKPCNTGQNITVLGALSLQGVIAPMTVEGGTDAEVFGAYIKDMLAPALRPGQVVIMDNLSSHKVEGIQEAIAAVGATLEYLPPYSPDLSPIEECWSKVKETLRAKAARTRTMLDVALASALHMITPADVKGWFAHCGYA